MEPQEIIYNTIHRYIEHVYSVGLSPQKWFYYEWLPNWTKLDIETINKSLRSLIDKGLILHETIQAEQRDTQGNKTLKKHIIFKLPKTVTDGFEKTTKKPRANN